MPAPSRSSQRVASSSQETDPNVNVCIKDIYEKLKILDDMDMNLKSLAGLKDEVQDLKRKLSDQDKALSDLTIRVDSLESDLSAKNERIAEIEQDGIQKTEQITKSQSTALNLVDKMNDQEQYSKRENLIITGLNFRKPVADIVQEGAANQAATSTEEDEVSLRDKDTMVTNLVTIVKNKLNIVIHPSDIQDIHLLKRTKPATEAANNANEAANNATEDNRDTPTSSIIVRFSNRRIRDRIYYSRTELVGTNIFINEQLTARNGRLFRLARAARRNKLIQKTWTSNGFVTVKTNDDDIIRIKSEEDLNNV